MIRYHGAAISAKTSSARGSNVARSQVLKSRRTRQKASVTQKGISTATGPFAITPRAAAANAAYSHWRPPDLRCSHAANIDAATSRLRSPSAVAERPMMKTPTEVAVQAAASHAAVAPYAARVNRNTSAHHSVAHSAVGSRNANSVGPKASTLAACSQYTRIGLS